MSAKKKVGFIGLGLMGHGMAKNIVEKGFPLTVLAHRNRGPVDDLLARGADEVQTAAELVRKCDVIFICVTGAPQVEDVVYRKDGLLEGMRDGVVVVDATTSLPEVTARVASDLATKGGRFLDAPLTRTPKEAEAGKLAVMIGGEPAHIEEISEIIECYADLIVPTGDVGSAHTVKLVNNFIAMGTAAVVSEGICAAAKSGVNLQALSDVVMAGGAASLMFERIIKVPLNDDDSALKFYMENAQKDLRYYTNMTETLESTSFLAEATHQTFMLANNLGHRDKYVPRLVNVLAEINGAKFEKS